MCGHQTTADRLPFIFQASFIIFRNLNRKSSFQFHLRPAKFFLTNLLPDSLSVFSCPPDRSSWNRALPRLAPLAPRSSTTSRWCRRTCCGPSRSPATSPSGSTSAWRTTRGTSSRGQPSAPHWKRLGEEVEEHEACLRVSTLVRRSGSRFHRLTQNHFNTVCVCVVRWNRISLSRGALTAGLFFCF